MKESEKNNSQTGSTRLITGKGEKVKLRAKLNSSGTESLFLDFTIEGKRKKEYLGLTVISGAGNAIDKDSNKKTLELAKGIRRTREDELKSITYDYIPDYKRNADFIQFFENYLENYSKGDIRMLRNTLTSFKKFIARDHILAKDVTTLLLQDFKEYLDRVFNGETPYDYFKKMKKVLKNATDQGFFRHNPAEGITNRKIEGIKKDILTFDEIIKLATARCGNAEVKRAFLFCCYTGLRFVDVKRLSEGHINGGVLEIVQQKTKQKVIINLNTSAQRLLDEKPTQEIGLIFDLPSNTACNKDIKVWAGRAGLKKKITWHCARHSFATNLLIYGADTTTVSSLLGQTSTRETEKYVRVVEKLKEDAVYRLPCIPMD